MNQERRAPGPACVHLDKSGNQSHRPLEGAHLQPNQNSRMYWPGFDPETLGGSKNPKIQASTTKPTLAPWLEMSSNLTKMKEPEKCNWQLRFQTINKRRG